MLINQALLTSQVKKLFPNEKVLENVRRHTNLKYSESGAFLEFDVWLPSLKIGFEFQDDYHYVSVFYNQDSQEKVFYKDTVKRHLAQRSGISLIVVPCWWSGTPDSLAASVQYQRPELAFNNVISPPISLNPPLGYFKNMDIPNIGDLMAPSFPIGTFDVDASPMKWWMGEKYDGVRYCWHPAQLRAYTRFGKAIELLYKISLQLSRIFLDGEFWFGRGHYHLTSPLVSDSTDLVYWDTFRMIPFDVPSPNYENKPFEERYRALLQHVPRNHAFSIIAPRVLCAGNQHLTLYVRGIIDDGGEGAVVRAVRSLYERNRSTSLLKLKTANADREAIVVEIDDDDSVVLKLPQGAKFSVSAQDVHVAGLSVGDVVSFSYENYARRDLPMNAKIYRIRTDISWPEVVYSSVKEEKFLSGAVAGFTTQPPNYWTKANMRKFMENAARARQLDPLRAETWYSLPVSYIYDITSGRMIMQRLKGYVNALLELFPDIKFDKNAFTRNSWNDIETRRVFFENYAAENEFDPLNPGNWYSQPIEKFTTIKGINNLLSYHKMSLPQALVDVFPNIGIVKSKFQPHYVYWNSIENRRKFFEDYAKEHGFNFANVERWYSHPHEKLMARQETRRVIQYHGMSVPQALSDLFPHLGFETAKFSSPNSFQTAERRRRTFERFAKARNFDPLVAENWYMYGTKDIDAFRGILAYHQYSLPSALMDLFPEVRFDKSKFFLNKGWKSTKKQRRFFENYAKQHKFSPLNPENWYNLSKKDLLKSKGAAMILRHHGNSVPKTLEALFPEMTLDRTKFFTNQRWLLKENRRQFFVDFAKENKFEPLQANNWYTQQKRSIFAFPGGHGVLAHYNNSIAQALIDLFPEVQFDVLKFPTNTIWTAKSPKHGTAIWSDRSNRRRFFEKCVSSLGLDPLRASTWYSLPKSRIRAMKGGAGILLHYNNSLPEALVDVFPEIGLDMSLFSSQSGKQND
eukprot:Phypoly_transcript_01262.p1 GENE.Phypoly_transcript_01262~~Phypoly_transcript_01262.p1  ORF type:complete len:970 (+),score=114.54 Phypoly_transcript_01262:138-3047(+)